MKRMKPFPARRVYLWLGVFLGLVAAAFLAPRLFASKGEGFAPAGEAVLMFLALCAAALGVSAFLFAGAWRARRELTPAARVAGLAPLPLAALGCLGLWLFLSYSG